MLKRIMPLMFACLLLSATIPPASVSAHTRDESASEVIWSGLWAGANLDIGSSLSDTNNSSPPRRAVDNNIPDRRPANQDINRRTVDRDTERRTVNQDIDRRNPHTDTTTRRNAAQPASVNKRTSKGLNYVALGDSVAAGVGLGAPAGASAEDTRCGRSTHAYGYIVAQSLQTPVHHIACSGATAGDLFTVQREGSPNVPPQLDRAFSHGTPDLITITAGANDVGWAGFIYHCYRADCESRAAEALAKTRLAVLEVKLHEAFRQIKQRSGNDTPPRVVISGYYNPLSSNCTRLQKNITADEINWLSGQIGALNRTIRTVADDYDFVRFAPVNFSGHDICSSDPWIQGLNSPARFHPTHDGQRAIAQSVLRTIRQ